MWIFPALPARTRNDASHRHAGSKFSASLRAQTIAGSSFRAFARSLRSRLPAGRQRARPRGTEGATLIIFYVASPAAIEAMRAYAPHHLRLRPPRMSSESSISKNRPNHGKRLPSTISEKRVAPITANAIGVGAGPQLRGPPNK
jgi:hypothetical protein